mmetsp:Transcript_14976/g.52560  ORF Transcript_14976/g.52560 Transcript_14976/m.52560 type:complete len:94 (-) Transcript_14976:43-324(-)
MGDGRVELGPMMYSAAVRACEQGEQWVQALELFSEIVDTCSKCNTPPSAVQQSVLARHGVGGQSRPARLHHVERRSHRLREGRSMGTGTAALP